MHLNYSDSVTIENRRATNEKDIQREAYFRQISGKDLNDVFQKWTTFLTVIDQPEKIDFLDNDLITRTMMYGSEKTVYILGVIIQKQQLRDTENLKPVEEMENLLYVANIITSLKCDFTGYEIDPMDLIATKVENLKSLELQSVIDEAKKNVSKKLAEKNRW